MTALAQEKGHHGHPDARNSAFETLIAHLSEKQREAVLHLAHADGSGDRGIAWWRVGEGKTRIALCWAIVRNAMRLLIVCSPGAIRQWQDEIKLLELDDVLEVGFLSYGLLSRGAASEKLAQDFSALDALIVDELWLYKNAKSRRSLTIAEYSRRLPTIGLSGSMITARNVEDLYGQARAVGISHLVARNITDFRSQYEIEVVNRFTQFVEWTPKPHAVEQIQQKLAGHIHVYFPKSTREIRDIDVRVAASPEQQKIKRELAKAYYYEHKDPGADGGFSLEVKSAAALVVKLQQVSDGFLRNAENAHLPIESAKLARLKELVSEFLDAGERVLIWCAFRHSVEIVRHTLGIRSVALSGDQQFNVEAWQSGEARVCVATVGSGASLNDFAHVRLAVFYSTRFSHLQHQQARGRTDRASSVGGRCYYYLQTENFPDAHVLRMIRESRTVEEGVIEITQAIVRDALKEK